MAEDVVGYRIVDAPDDGERAAAYALRARVFIDEQRVPADLERDAHDDTADHVVLLAGDVAVATGRVRLVDGVAKVERVAVDRALRGTGLGRRIMEALEARAVRLGATTVKLAAQVSAIAFYERLGYVAYDPPFMDAGIEHRWMRKRL